MVEEVCPLHPGKRELMKNKVTDAFKKMQKNKARIETLVFLFSGHYKEGKYFLGSRMDYITHNDLEQELKSLSDFVHTFVIFLDCCGAPYFECLSKMPVSVVQLNACNTENETSVNENGSLFTRFIIQALVGEANGIPCRFRKAHKCIIPGDFITILSLQEYVICHTDLYYESCGGARKSTHKISISKADPRNAVVAYNLHCVVLLTFTFPELSKDLETQVSPVKYQTMAELRCFLFEKYIGK